MRNRKNLLAVRLVCVIMVVTLCIGVLCACDRHHEDPPASPQKETIRFQKAADSVDGYASVYLPSDGKLNILQLSDPQVDTSEKYRVIDASNDLTYDFIAKLIAGSDADMIVIAGDLVMSTLESNYAYLVRYAEVLEATGLPWTITFGNHDCEATYVALSGGKVSNEQDIGTGKTLYGQISKESAVELLSAYPHCLLTEGDCEDGLGNNFINVKNNEEQIVYTICTLDTLYTGSGLDSDYSRYPSAVQTEWYARNITAISDLRYGTTRTAEQVVPSAVYLHVGLPEFYTAWSEAFTNGQPNEHYFYGHRTDGNYTSYIPECDFFPTLKEMGSTTAVFFGHHHDNDMSVEYQGIRLTFGQHSGLAHTYRINRVDDTYRVWDFTTYDRYGDQRGGTQFTVNADGSFVITPIYATEVIPDYASIQIDAEALAARLVADGQTVYRVNPETDEEYIQK